MAATKFSPEIILDDAQEKLKATIMKLMESPDVQAVIRRSSQGPITVSSSPVMNRDRATTNVKDRGSKRQRKQKPI